MTTSKIQTLQPDPTFEPKQRDNESFRCSLKWRQGQLYVSLEQQPLQPFLPALENEQLLVECLKHSPVRLIRIDPAVGEASVKFWADACEQADKAVFLRLSAAHALPRGKHALRWWLLRLIDWNAAALLLLVLSPLMLGLVCLMRTQSPQTPIFLRQWYVGERGKLFRLFKFRSLVINAQTLEPQEAIGNQKNLLRNEERSGITPLGHWMCRYNLDKLPQLFNVLLGEMSLLGACPWTLYDAVGLSLEDQRQLNVLPGITGARLKCR